MHDLVIRGGTVVDGSGDDRFVGDIAVDGGTISAVGSVPDRGEEELDASGLLVTPGFVDIHSHFDGQVTWDPHLTPSSWHGVTTVLMGNCGVGFAPVKADRRDWLIGLMEGVEDIPGTALWEGIQWEWETFPEYLDSVERRSLAIDVAAQVPHSAVRTYVMGERGADHTERATPAEIVEMARLTREAIDAGALGLGTSRTQAQADRDGNPVPTLTASAEELIALARALRDSGTGVIEIVADFKDIDGDDTDFALIRRIAQESGRPVSLPVAESTADPDIWRKLIARISAAADEGLTMRGQVLGRQVGMLLSWEGSLHPFTATPTYESIAELPFPERLAKLRDPDIRRRILTEQPQRRRRIDRVAATAFEQMWPLGDPVDYERPADRSVAAMAAVAGVTPAELAYDLLLEDDGNGLLFLPAFNYAHANLDSSREMILSPHTVQGLSDAGAHCGYVCDASVPTFLLTHWARDRTRGEHISVEWLIRRLTSDTAAWIGLDDRGLVQPGRRADLNLIDFDRLRLHPPRVVHDLPAGGRRIVQEADGYVATIVRGETIRRDGVDTGALPGRLIRGPQHAA